MLRLLLTSANGLVKSNGNFQGQSDKAFSDIGFIPSPLCQQLSLPIHGRILITMAAKTFDDLLIAGPPAVSDPIIESINERFQLETVVYSPVMLPYFGFNIT